MDIGVTCTEWNVFCWKRAEVTRDLIDTVENVGTGKIENLYLKAGISVEYNNVRCDNHFRNIHHVNENNLQPSDTHTFYI